MRLGYVTDFVHVYWRGHQWPDFNVADSAISIGIVLLLVDAVRPAPGLTGRRAIAGETTPVALAGTTAPVRWTVAPPPAMGISLKGEHLKRYKDIAALFMKYGRSDLVKGAGLEEVAPEAGGRARPRRAWPSSWPPTSRSWGRPSSSSGSSCPRAPTCSPCPYMEALARLQDKVEPFPFLEVEAIVSAELGVRLSKAFSEFEEEPMAAASLGQVHRAALRDGRRVAVKVQRPGIREQHRRGPGGPGRDRRLRRPAHRDRAAASGSRPMLEEFRKTLLRELDYQQEARNLQTLAENLRGVRPHRRARSPSRTTRPRASSPSTTSAAQKITKLSPLVRTEIDGEALAEQLFRAYLQQILVDGFVHADPHPGNVFLTDDNRIALLDLGMVARIPPGMQEKLLRLLLAVSEGRADEAATVAIALGDVQPALRRDGLPPRRGRPRGPEPGRHASARSRSGRVVLDAGPHVAASAASACRPS